MRGARAGRWCWARPSTCSPHRAGGWRCSAAPCDLLIRHYKTDWWGERLPIWADEDPYPDPEPLAGPLAVLLPAIAAGRCAVVNPFGAVLTQNKRMLAFLWERQQRLSPAGQAAVRAHVPRDAAAGGDRSARSWRPSRPTGC